MGRVKRVSGSKGRLARAVLLIALAFSQSPLFGQGTWRGLTVAAEVRCSPYEAGDYRYPPSIESDIIADLGGIYSPYTGQRFSSPRETDIEHMVARSEAHDSGLCAADLATRRAFSRDLRNLTLAAPSLNREIKGARDAAGWMPERNRCWFASRVVAVRQRWGLTIDVREASALEAVLSGCATTSMGAGEHAGFESPEPGSLEDVQPDALRLWDDNRNGMITCAEARRHGIAPVPRGHPAYPFMRDGDGDGVVCEGTS